MSKNVVRFIVILALVGFLFLSGFAVGAMADRFLLSDVNPFNSAPAETADPEQAAGVDQDLLEEAYEVIEENFVGRDAIDSKELTYGALAGMVDALGDTGHSRFMTPEVMTSENRSLEGEFEGIGAQVTMRDGMAVIVTPMDNSPAMEAGLKPGDIIIAVDGEDMTGLTLTEVVDHILGPAGTEVTITVSRPETEEILDFTITRARIEVHNVTWIMLPGTQIAHIRISQYSQRVAADLKKALKEAQDAGAEGVIFDLRNNPGGLLDEAEGVVSQFIKEGNVLQVRDAQGRVQDVPVKRGGVAYEIPVVVLINEGSASASEITAGALQDYERATLVGQKTFGTGTVLNQFTLSDGSAILLAVQEWLTPLGRQIWHQGIEPDIVVDMPLSVTLLTPESERDMTAEELWATEDVQLLKALEVLGVTK